MNAVPDTSPRDVTMTERLVRQCRQIGAKAFTSPDHRRGTVRHVVLLHFAETITLAQRQEAIEAFVRLKDECIRDGRPYIRSIEHGTQNGVENKHGFEHAFLVTFDSEGDRNFYAGRPIVDDDHYCDAAHEAFKDLIRPSLAPGGLLVFDYSPA